MYTLQDLTQHTNKQTNKVQFAINYAFQIK